MVEEPAVVGLVAVPVPGLDVVEAADELAVAGPDFLEQRVAGEGGVGQPGGGLGEVLDALVGVAQDVGLFPCEVRVGGFDGADLPVQRVDVAEAGPHGGRNGDVGLAHVVPEPLQVGVVPPLGGLLHGDNTGHGQAPEGIVLVAPG